MPVPAVHAFVRPGADARRDQQVDPACVVGRVQVDEAQGAVHATGFVAMHAAGDQRTEQLVAPVAAFEREQRVAVGAITQAAVLHHVEA